MIFQKFANMPIWKQYVLYLIYQVIANVTMIFEYILVRKYFDSSFLHFFYLVLIVVLSIIFGNKLKNKVLKIITICIFVLVNIYSFMIGGLFCGEAI